MYYHLLHALRSKKIHDTVIVRIEQVQVLRHGIYESQFVEQLAPFPYPEVSSFLSKYKNAGIVWAQVCRALCMLCILKGMLGGTQKYGSLGICAATISNNAVQNI